MIIKPQTKMKFTALIALVGALSAQQAMAVRLQEETQLSAYIGWLNEADAATEQMTRVIETLPEAAENAPAETPEQPTQPEQPIKEPIKEPIKKEIIRPEMPEQAPEDKVINEMPIKK